MTHHITFPCELPRLCQLLPVHPVGELFKDRRNSLLRLLHIVHLLRKFLVPLRSLLNRADKIVLGELRRRHVSAKVVPDVGEVGFKCFSIFSNSRRYFMHHCVSNPKLIFRTFWTLYFFFPDYAVSYILPPFRSLFKRHFNIFQRISRRTGVLVEPAANSLIGPNSCWIFSNFFRGH
ncbi:MAG: hypothetical protein JW395_1281 [Nitrospira sp.]|nr:hypothetical protein [Nitrospira sp.]